MPTGMGGRGQGGGKADLGLCTPAEQAVARLAGRHGGLHVGGGRGGARGLEHDLLLDDLEQRWGEEEERRFGRVLPRYLRQPPSRLAGIGVGGEVARHHAVLLRRPKIDANHAVSRNPANVLNLLRELGLARTRAAGDDDGAACHRVRSP